MVLSWLLILGIQAFLVSAVGLWHLRAYRKAARRSRHELERIIATDQTSTLRAELEYVRERHDILLRGLFPQGEVFLGNFIEQDPELRALCELIEICKSPTRLPSARG